MMEGQGRRSDVVVCQGVSKSFEAHGHAFRALTNVGFSAADAAVTALVGSDGAGKTTLLRLIAGLLPPDEGALSVLGMDVTTAPEQVQARIGYMPQRFGLYEDLTVQENLDLYADLHDVSPDDRRRKHPQLMQMTALGPFQRRLAGQLSGGMKQKLGLACTLISTPELLLLDEPTAGVDPLSRRELWQIVQALVRDTGLPIIVSTSYLDEADRCDHILVLHEGAVLAQGDPKSVGRRVAGRVFTAVPSPGQRARELQARLMDEPWVIDAAPEGGQVRLVLDTSDLAQTPLRADPGVAEIHAVNADFEDGFMALLRAAVASEPPAPHSAEPIRLGRTVRRDEAIAVRVDNLVRRFGGFTAVDNVSFKVQAGEVFGLLGPNGAGKTTTFRMLCGLLAATSGELWVGGADMRRARATARGRIGYVAQKFSLYGQLSVAENLEFFSSVYGLHGAQKRERIGWALDQFELARFARIPAARLAGGFRQRLAMAAALLHEPELLFLDEPTSGADPLARRDFWRRITALSDQGVTVIVTTHFMAEAEYCDRIAIMDGGRVLAEGAPQEIRVRGRGETGAEPTMEDAFIAIVQAARAQSKGAAA